jgi:tripartite-type tricarboxylate transporter receptor subunit TctC
VSLRRLVFRVTCGALALAGAGGACAQDFSSKPIRIFAGSAGGSADFSSRLIAQGLAASLGQPPIIDNRGGIVDVRALLVVKSPPDGLTLMFTSAAMWLAPFLRDKVPFDPLKDFTPIVLTTMSPTVLVVHPSLPAKSVKELIAFAKARPGQLNYAVGSLNASSHLAGELFKTMAGINLVVVPYKGSGPQITGVLSGEVPITFASAAAVAPHLKDGRLRALAITSPQRSVLAPELPTVAASGLPGYELVSRYGLMGAAKTPDAIVSRLNREVVQFITQPDIRQTFMDSGVEVIGSSPKEFAAAISHEMTTLGKVMKDAGFRE